MKPTRGNRCASVADVCYNSEAFEMPTWSSWLRRDRQSTDCAENARKRIEPVYKRIVLKLSGESLRGRRDFGIHAETIQGIAQEVKEVHDLGVEVAIMVGGGNIFPRRPPEGISRSIAPPATTWACWRR